MNKQWNNLYFGGKVRSINSTLNGYRLTEGEIDPGEYTFSTANEEHMTVNFGQLFVKLAGESDFKIFDVGQTFIVPENSSFQVQAKELVKYICKYIDK